ncbi:MAG: PrkA family serine protein kinase, partial [Gemmatimonadota bacterium]
MDIIGFIKEHQDRSQFHDLHWEGSFTEYLGMVRENPQISRNAFQRLYDMILSWGVEEYTEYKKKITHFTFFDDPIDGGRDAVYGLDVALMKLVQVLKAAAMSYGPERRVILLH